MSTTVTQLRSGSTCPDQTWQAVPISTTTAWTYLTSLLPRRAYLVKDGTP